MSKTKDNVPDWLLHIPAGLYSTLDLIKITNHTRFNIWARMNALGVDVEKVKQKGSGHYAVNMYNWKGAKFYIQKQFDDKINKMDGNNGKEKI